MSERCFQKIVILQICRNARMNSIITTINSEHNYVITAKLKTQLCIPDFCSASLKPLFECNWFLQRCRVVCCLHTMLFLFTRANVFQIHYGYPVCFCWWRWYPNDQGSNQGSNFQSQHTTDDNIDIAVIPPPPKIAKFEKTPDLKSKKPPIISCPRCQKCFTRKNSLNEHRKSCLRKLFFRFQYFRWRRGQMKTCFIWGYKICFGSGRVPNFAKYAKMIVLGQIYIHQLAEFRCWCLKCFIRKGSYSWQVRHIESFLTL